MKKVLGIFLGASCLMACSGGSGDSLGKTSTSELAGIWQGTVTQSAGTASTIGLIRRSGEYHFLSGNETSYNTGVFQISGDRFSGSGVEYDDGEPEIVSLSGDFVSKQSLSGIGRVNGVQTSSFELAYDGISERGSSLQRVSGYYASGDGSSYTEIFTIHSSGEIVGYASDGCLFEGTISIVNAAYNDYDVSLTVSNCDVNGSYSGAAVLIDRDEIDDTILYFLESDQHVIAGSWTRQ